MKISVIIPVLNEETAIRKMLPEMQWIRESGHELIVVDGGSTDDSFALARNFSDAVIVSTQGRAVQMNAGAKIATGDVLLFLHIDTILPTDSLSKILTSVNWGNTQNNSQVEKAWGRFDVRLSGSHFMFRIIELLMNWRSRMTGIATGDQAIFVSKELFEHIGGYKEIPLMEDIEISRRLKKISKPVCIQERVIASSRRWEVSGIYRTVFLMWRLRLSYWLGVDPVRLVKQYYS
ncbi:MAG: TIGR04283 family arsenosugar biosynthesis glycosyltransferase [Gammaproteobacteria bacterium]|nr:TIGR04283 family arsenosugar biosynthesis glycosyltransferase [Gammaproteobacteria bacterium]